jgi:predicted transcriptional regulator
MKHILHYLLVATRGGEMRTKIIKLIIKKPSNLNKISKALKIDYKTAQHHIKVLEKSRIIIAINKGNYGAAYFIAPELEQEIKIIDEIWKESGKK